VVRGWWNGSQPLISTTRGLITLVEFVVVGHSSWIACSIPLNQFRHPHVEGAPNIETVLGLKNHLETDPVVGFEVPT
jgi:hypothetical protein